MFCEKVICAGFGGQGVMSLGQLLAYAGMIEGRNVTWIPSYGPEMRGGTAYCCVIISDKSVGSPLITDDANCAIVMNLPSLVKFAPRVIPGGLLLINSSLVGQNDTREDLDAYNIPALEEAVACGNGKMANMVMLGGYLALTGIVRPSSILEAFEKVFGARANHLFSLNSEALKRGMDFVNGLSPVSAVA